MNKPLGITNLKNDCYIISIMQCWYHIPIFNKEVLDYNKLKNNIEKINNNLKLLNSKRNFVVTIELHFIFKQLINNKLDDLLKSIYNLKKCLLDGKYNNDKQYDCMEFFNNLIEEFYKENNIIFNKINSSKNVFKNIYDKWCFNNDKLEKTIFDDLFFGHLYIVLKCTHCLNEKKSFQKFDQLILDIKEESTIEDLISNYYKIEYISDIYCDKCKNRTKFIKNEYFVKFPKILVIVLKRIKYFPILKKNYFYIKVLDIVLNMSKYSLNKNKPVIYSLKSSIEHLGNENKGHYISYCENLHNKNWYIFDDEKVLQRDKFQGIKSKKLYCLFYQLDS